MSKFRNLCAKLWTIETRVSIFIVLFNNKNLRYLCLVLFSESSGTEPAIIHPRFNWNSPSSKKRFISIPREKKQWNFGELFKSVEKSKLNRTLLSYYTLDEYKMTRIHLLKRLLKRYYWNRYKMSGLERSVRIIYRLVVVGGSLTPVSKTTPDGRVISPKLQLFDAFFHFVV